MCLQGGLSGGGVMGQGVGAAEGGTNARASEGKELPTRKPMVGRPLEPAYWVLNAPSVSELFKVTTVLNIS